MADIRIFSYLPNPRVMKATIAARLNGVDVEVRGAGQQEMADWLWDFDAREITQQDRDSGEHAVAARTGFSGTLYKTQAFLKAHPYGAVPAAFGDGGKVGIFESNSIMRAVARLGHDRMPLYGTDALAASRIDGFLDIALLFAKEAQTYLLAIADRSIDQPTYAAMSAAAHAYLQGIEVALGDTAFIAGDELTIADICYACEMSLFARERAAAGRLEKIDRTPIWPELEAAFPNSLGHYRQLLDLPEFNADLGAYVTQIEARAAERS